MLWLLGALAERFAGGLWSRGQTDVIGTHGPFLASQEARQADNVHFLMLFSTSKAVFMPKELHMYVQKVLDLSAYLQEIGQRNMLNDATRPE